jgi:hypothetical protein
VEVLEAGAEMAALVAVVRLVARQVSPVVEAAVARVLELPVRTEVQEQTIQVRQVAQAEATLRALVAVLVALMLLVRQDQTEAEAAGRVLILLLGLLVGQGATARIGEQGTKVRRVVVVVVPDQQAALRHRAGTVGSGAVVVLAAVTLAAPHQQAGVVDKALSSLPHPLFLFHFVVVVPPAQMAAENSFIPLRQLEAARCFVTQWSMSRFCWLAVAAVGRAAAAVPDRCCPRQRQ